MKNQKRVGMKQYCAEPEIDPFESLYWKSDVFEDYMASCQLPKIGEYLGDPVDLLETIDNIDLPAHRLTNRVRCQYLNFLNKLLDTNFEVWSNTMETYESDTFTLDEVRQCAENIEMKAVQSCMIVSLYRNYILKVISQIRKDTKESNLHSNLKSMKFMPKLIKKETCNVSVQTEVYEPMVSFHDSKPIVKAEPPLPIVHAMSLDEKIRNFEKKIHTSRSSFYSKKQKRHKDKNNIEHTERRRSRSREQLTFDDGEKLMKNDSIRSEQNHPRSDQISECETRQIVSISVPPKLIAMNDPTKQNETIDDQIMRELEAMFETNDDENIFDSCENHVQINAIISEIEKFDPPKHDERNMNSQQSFEPKQINAKNSESDGDATSKENNSKQVDLRKSLWPCEFHMHKMKLRELLSNIAEKDFLRYERIRAKFLLLFGENEDDDDELIGPYSPSIELNEVLISSCRQRIAKWVVQALMKPLEDGMIGNRFIFKKLAKHLADSIIFLNQYPDQRFIRNYIADYFCTHPSILSVDDMN